MCRRGEAQLHISTWIFNILMENKGRSIVLRYVWCIVAVQVIAFLAWVGLYPDARVENYDSVRAALKVIQNGAPNQPEFTMASSAIHSATKNLELLNVVMLIASFSILILSILIWVRVRKMEPSNSKVESSH